MSARLSSVASAPAYQTCFSADPSSYSNLSTNHQEDRLKSMKNSVINNSQDDTHQFATDSNLSNHSSIQSHSNSSSNLQIRYTSTSTPSSPLSPNSLSTKTRLRAMGNLTEAMERRKAKENIEATPSYKLPKPTPTIINPRRDEKKALGLRAAVGSYKMRCSGTKSLSASPITSDQFEIPVKLPHTSSLSKSKPLETVTNMSWVDTPESRLKHSQYLAARRESIIGRVGGHRRVVSESTTSLKSAPTTPSQSLRPTPSITTLPSLDQISSWVALRKNNVTDSSEEDSTLSSPTWNGYSMDSNRPSLNVKSKSLPIYSNTHDPAIPRICLSSDSDEEDDCNDQSDETQSEPPCSAIPIMLNTSALKSASPSMERSLDFKCTLIASASPTTSNHRAVQRQALLANLALARRRRTTNENSTPQYVAPV